MKFNAEYIELDHDDSWFLQGFDQQIDYESLAELYWQTAACYEEAVSQEFAQLADTRWHDSSSLETGLKDPQVASAYSTHLAGKLVSLNSVLCHYIKSSDVLD